MTPPAVDELRLLVDAVRHDDDLGARHRAQALTWLEATNDVYRRVKPRTPSPHLVSYFLLVDRQAQREDPFFLTVTDTVGAPADRHTDVTLWFALTGVRNQPLVPDAREFGSVRWFGRDDVLAASPGRIEPHLLRALDVLIGPERVS